MVRYNPELDRGLTAEQVKVRKEEGFVNVSDSNKTRSYGQILFNNIFTLFNFVNLVLAIVIISTGSLKNLLFLGVTFWNIVIGTVQEIRSKIALDKIALIVESKLQVLRDGVIQKIPLEEVVLDDIVLTQSGNQITSDSIVVEGLLEVDESLLTGESDVVQKKEGDELYSGSFVVSGQGKIKVNHVGSDNYAEKITQVAKKFAQYPSQLRDSLNHIIKIIGLLIIPLGILMFVQSYVFLGNSYNTAVLNMSAALIGMIPEGLVILTSIALAVGVINLAKHKTLVQELYCIETLARVDVLCLDKTGTITEGNMEVYDSYLFQDIDLDVIMGNYLQHAQNKNATFEALRIMYPPREHYHFLHIVPFSSERKYSMIIFEECTYVLGAYECVAQKEEEKQQKLMELSAQGFRVLTLCKSDEVTIRDTLPEKLEVLAFIVLVDKIRSNAINTLKYLKNQKIELKVISGDNHITVSEVAKRAGVEDAELFLDASKLDEQELREKVQNICVFGRVRPEQKKIMIEGLRKKKHVVAMTGDGVNDVQAFKASDISIAMASGSDIARSTANLVLLDNNFDALPYVLYEGRRVINNIEKVATLFLTKTIFSFVLAFMVIMLNVSYPFIPIQLTFISAFTIGIPAFVLALEPNRERVKGKFMDNVLKISLPAGLSVVTAIGYCYIAQYNKLINAMQLKQLALIILAINGMLVLFKVTRPFSWLRTVLFLLMGLALSSGFLFFHSFLNLNKIDFYSLRSHILIVAVIVILLSFLLQEVVKIIRK